MTLRDRLTAALKDAMRAKDSMRLAVIRSVKAAVLQAETRGERTSLDDDGILAVIVKEVKMRKDSVLEYDRAGRPDIVDQLQQEIALLQQYLPEPLEADALRQLVTEAVDATGAGGPQDMGRVMGWLTPRIRGRADGKTVSECVKTALQQRARTQ